MFEKVGEGSRRSLEGSRRSLEGSRKAEKLREGRRRFEKVRESWRRFEKVREGILLLCYYVFNTFSFVFDCF